MVFPLNKSLTLQMNFFCNGFSFFAAVNQMFLIPNHISVGQQKKEKRGGPPKKTFFLPRDTLIPPPPHAQVLFFLL